MTHHHDDHSHDHKHHSHSHTHSHHDDSHSHNHNHHHGHSHDHHQAGQDLKSPMTDREKLLKLMDHWVAHNNDHAKNYLQWSKKAEELGFEKAGQLLKDAAELTDAISEKFLQCKDNIT